MRKTTSFFRFRNNLGEMGFYRETMDRGKSSGESQVVRVRFRHFGNKSPFRTLGKADHEESLFLCARHTYMKVSTISLRTSLVVHMSRAGKVLRVVSN